MAILTVAMGLKAIKLGATLIGIGAAVAATGVVVSRLSKEAREDTKELVEALP